MRLSELKAALDKAAAECGYDDPEVVVEDASSLSALDVRCVGIGDGCTRGSLVIVPD